MALTQPWDGMLLLEDGARWEGRLAGVRRDGIGELVFTTNLTGYQEVLTDPSYAGQIVVMTAPMIGNYGVNPADLQAPAPRVAGFVVRELSPTATGPRASGTLEDWLREEGVPVLTGCDTRAVTRHIRALGAMRALIAPVTTEPDDALIRLRRHPSMEGLDLASGVGAAEPTSVPAAVEERGRLVCLDYGVKRRSIELLSAEGFRIDVMPAATSADEILGRRPAGVFISNGPGDPAAIPDAAEKVRRIAESGVPVFGICLGCQLVARAFGGRTTKLPYGHRGGNHPVRNLDTGAVEITSQNHGFAVVEEAGEVAGAPALRVTHRSLNDGTIEGLEHRTLPVFAVQYHPESAPGPHDSRYLFERFVAAMDARRATPTG